MKILLVGDIAAKAGLHAIRRALPRLIVDQKVDFVVANGENIAGGIGITPDLADELFDNGIHVITTGNHIWRQREIKTYIENERRLLRPFNFIEGQPGYGFGIYETAAGIKVGVINLIGQVYMDPADNPFVAAEKALKKLGGTKIILVDMHAEATSERRAMGFHLEGRVTAVVGTHTHVQTSDDQILQGKTAYITDLGMTGPHDSVIGMRKDLVLERFRTGLYHSYKPAKSGTRLQGLLIEADQTTGHALSTKRIDIPVLDKK